MLELNTLIIWKVTYAASLTVKSKLNFENGLKFKP